MSQALDLNHYQMSITLSGPRQLFWPVFSILITDF
jgi:hypothetical protein